LLLHNKCNSIKIAKEINGVSAIEINERKTYRVRTR
jgi:hypothetical protein